MMEQSAEAQAESAADTVAVTGKGTCPVCPIHQPGKATLAGAVMGTAGAGLAALAGSLLPAAGSEAGLSDHWPVLWASLAGLLGAAAGLMLGLRGVSLYNPIRSVVFAMLLLAGTGAAVGLLHSQTMAALQFAGVGALTGIPVGFFGRLLAGKPAASCPLPENDPAEAGSHQKSVREGERGVSTP
jgi:hypothetical protein